jgi:hypothetical protein
LSVKVKDSKPERVDTLITAEKLAVEKAIKMRNLSDYFHQNFKFPQFSGLWNNATPESGVANFKSVELLVNGFILGLCFNPKTVEQPEQPETVVKETISAETGRKSNVRRTIPQPEKDLIPVS